MAFCSQQHQSSASCESGKTDALSVKIVHRRARFFELKQVDAAIGLKINRSFNFSFSLFMFFFLYFEITQVQN